MLYMYTMGDNSGDGGEKYRAHTQQKQNGHLIQARVYMYWRV